MAMTINTNSVSINAQRNLSQSAGALSTSMQRLSSGLRVNSAKDDAAGLAISERMNAQSKGLTVAARNANDGISLAQTAEGALGKIGDMLQRTRELAVQASNATNSDTDRKAMQAEVSQLVQEIDRVAKTTSFNGKNLLDGSFGGALFQVGANAGNNITIGSLGNTKAAELGTATYAKAAAVTQASLGGASLGAGTLTFNSVSIDVAAVGTASERGAQVVAAINSQTASTGLTAISDGTNVTFVSDAAKGAMDVSFTPAGSTTAATLSATSATVAVVATDAKGVANMSVTTQAGAWEALKKVDAALNQVNASRGELGALQTRFEKTVENIDIQSENISASRGRIVDADFAVETANLSRSQILQQAGTAMVAQANQLPQSVLSLLR